MTPAARLAAAIEVMDRVLAGAAVEPVLTNWGRANRFAGSGDRHAIRDLVYDALRCQRSFAALGGGMSGRGLMLGLLRAQGRDPADYFTAIGHAPSALGPQDEGRPPQGAAALDVPDWLLPRLQSSLGSECATILQLMRQRAPTFLRVNLARISRAEAARQLASEGIGTVPHASVSSALQVTENARKIQMSAAYLTGLVELQDAASQAVMEVLDLRADLRVLDYCAGGGGKTLAIAARGCEPDAHDISLSRMKDLLARAARAGARIRIVENPAKTAPYDLILIDAPCSGSGSWRRDPQGKWALTPERLAALQQVQAEILARAVPLLAKGGSLAYATCSLLTDENEDQVARFLTTHPSFCLTGQHRFSPLDGGDGFYVAVLTGVSPQTTQP